MSDLIQYNKLNNSYKKTLVFHLGVEAGFFSEYNNMILAMLYCLKHKIKFVLFSKDSNFRFKNGWTDFFLPFCDEQKNNFLLSKYNQRRSRLKARHKIVIKLYKIFNKIDYFTYDLWNSIRNRNIETEKYSIPELNINGNILEACRVLINLTWNYNESTSRKIQEIKESLGLPFSYIGFHIRMGDKNIESNLRPINEYINKSQIFSPLKVAFVLTDDYRVIDFLEENYRDWTFYTLCDRNENGYFHNNFQKESLEKRKLSHFRLFASIDILSKSELFVGTFSSNPGMFLGMKMDTSRCLGVDLEKWQIW